MARPKKEQQPFLEDGVTPNPNYKSPDELLDQLNEANAKIAALTPEQQKKPDKPYTSDEIAAHKADGHVIGMPSQKLVQGHGDSDLQIWDFVLCQLDLIDGVLIPEIHQGPVSAPESITPLKVEKTNTGNDKTFQKMNNLTNWRWRGANNQIFLYLPKGEYELGKKMEASYWIETTNAGRQGQKKHDRLLIKASPRATGAPVK